MCVCVAVVIQYATRMRHITSSVAGLVLLCFATLYHEGHDFRKKVIERKKCILIFSTTLPSKFLILRRNERDMIINVSRSPFTVSQ